MKFGFIIPHNFGLNDPNDVLDIATMAESLGFDSVWVNHHVLHAGYVLDRLGDKPYYDALTVLTYVGARTKSVKLGTTVLVLPYLNPIVLAKTLATLDVMSGGRVIVGIGVGSLPEESCALGSDYKNRGSYANESIKIMKELWTNSDPDFQGENYSFSGVKFSPKPLQKPHPPILVGGQSMPALRRAAQLGDGWHPIALSSNKLEIKLKTLNDLLIKNGRSLSGFKVSVRSELNVTEEKITDGTSPTIGTPVQLVESINEYADLGVNEMVFSVSTDNVPFIRNVMERFAVDVMPKCTS